MNVTTLKELITYSPTDTMTTDPILFGPSGLRQYAHNHQNVYNEWIHFFFMPFVVHGALIMCASLARFKSRQKILVKCVFYSYIAYNVIYIDYWFGWFTALTFSSTLFCVLNIIESRGASFFRGMKTLLFGIVIQEVFGHILAEQEMSYIYEIPNAILNSPGFAASVPLIEQDMNLVFSNSTLDIWGKATVTYLLLGQESFIDLMLTLFIGALVINVF